MILKNDGYVSAGGYTIFGQSGKLLVEPNGQEKYNTAEELLFHFCNKALISFGEGLGKESKFNPINHVERTFQKLTKARERNSITKKLELYLDSGGFQCAMGYLTKNQLKQFADCYFEFCRDHHDLFDWAFSLDLPPADYLFDGNDEMFEYNKYAYGRLFGELDEQTRKKILFVKHFRTPSQFNVWNRLIDDDVIFKGFNSNYWSIGGIVASLSGESTIPYVTYSLPFAEILTWCREHNKKEVALHILGGCAYRDLFFYALTKRVVKLKMDMNLEITYDSSGLAKQILLGRFINTIEDDGRIDKMSFMSNELDNMWKKGQTVQQHLFSIFEEMFEYTKVKLLLPDKIYGPDKLDYYAETLLLIYQLYTFKKLKDDFEKFAETMELEDFENEERFNQRVIPILLKINNHKISAKFKNKTNNFFISLKYLMEGDRIKNKKYIEYYMSKDEIKFKNGIKIETF